MEMITMKKLFCIAVVVLMLCSFVLSTSALISPQETEHPTTPSATTPGNPDKTSPKTGDPTLMIFGLAALGVGAGAVAVKKIKE